MQIHVVRNWCYLGSVNDTEEAALLDTVAPGFDADGYRILCKPVLEGRVEVVDLSA
jgi:excinuclease Cho